MNSRNLIIAAAAVILGILAVYFGNIYFSGIAERSAERAESQRMTRIVVAMQEMSFGSAVSKQNTRLADWPASSVPHGAFTSIEDATKNRVALRPIAVGEPVLLSKVSGIDGRAVLSENLPEGMFAFTVPISANSGVGGFVRPADIVDVLLTRQIPGDNSSGNDKMTDVILQSVPVLAIDLVKSDRETDPAIGKTATLQVTTNQAQKLALATKIGALDLALRGPTNQIQESARTVVPRDLTTGRYVVASRSGHAAPPRPSGVFKPKRPGPSMTVVRGVNPTQYEVSRGF